jgi:hypothetical protein
MVMVMIVVMATLILVDEVGQMGGDLVDPKRRFRGIFSRTGTWVRGAAPRLACTKPSTRASRNGKAVSRGRWARTSNATCRYGGAIPG